MLSDPEQYFLPPTTHVPNSRLPALVYRNVLQSDAADSSPTAASVTTQIEQNRWIKGGVFKTYWAHHFHSITHEAYAVFKGRSRFLLGRGPLDSDEDVQASHGKRSRAEVDLKVGDVIVLPAGVAHCSVTSDDDFEYVGLYPEPHKFLQRRLQIQGSPKYDNNWCKANEEETREKAENARNVVIPDCDPVYGQDGPLVRLWNDADARAK